MSWNRFVGIAILLYGLTNPVGVIPNVIPCTAPDGCPETAQAASEATTAGQSTSHVAAF
jgi:hypothetical protein